MRKVLLALVLFQSRTAAADCTQSQEVVTLLNEGDQLRASNIDDAIAKYARATDIEPTNHVALFKLSKAYAKKEDWRKVKIAITAAFKLAPLHADYAYVLGWASMQLTEWADARIAFETATKLDPSYADPHYDLAEILLRSGDDAGALTHYTRAIQIAPNRLDQYPALAELYFELGYHSLAVKVLDEALRWDDGKSPNAVFAIQSLYGAVLERKHDPSSLVHFEKALAACGPCNERGQQIATFNLGVAYARAKPPRKAEAKELLQRFEKTVCRGAAAARYADQCTEAQIIFSTLGP